MTTIVAGHFQSQSTAEKAMAALGAAGFDQAHLASFYVSPAGQHDLTHFDLLSPLRRIPG